MASVSDKDTLEKLMMEHDQDICRERVKHHHHSSNGSCHHGHHHGHHSTVVCLHEHTADDFNVDYAASTGTQVGEHSNNYNSNNNNNNSRVLFSDINTNQKTNKSSPEGSRPSLVPPPSPKTESSRKPPKSPFRKGVGGSEGPGGAGGAGDSATASKYGPAPKGLISNRYLQAKQNHRNMFQFYELHYAP